VQLTARGRIRIDPGGGVHVGGGGGVGRIVIVTDRYSDDDGLASPEASIVSDQDAPLPASSR
jgi:hypothetical protein